MGWGLRGLHAPGVEVALLGKDGCTLLEGGCNSQRWVERVRELRPDATLVYLAGAYLHGYSADDGWHTACYADWDQKLEQELTQRLSDLQGAPSRVFAATLPYPLGAWDTPEYRGQIDCINAVLRKASAAAPAVTLLDVSEQLCPQRTCKTRLASGAVVRPDGVHFSLEGARDIASWVLGQMRRPANAAAH
jgi:lysophospholipase L1-like esterase